MALHSVTRRRALAGGALAAGGAALAAGCGAQGAGSPAPAAAKGPVTVTYMSNLAESHPEGAARLYLLDEFNKTNEQKITVNVEEGRGATALDKYKSLAAGGTPPDVAYAAYYHTADMFAAGMLVDVDSELKAEKDWARQRADMYPAMLESSTWTGKLVSLPGYTNNVAMIYNTGLLQQAGVAAPKQGWTWDDFRAALQKFSGRQGLTALSMNWSFWTHYLRTMDASPISQDARKITVDTPESLQIMELLLGYIKGGFTPADGKTELYREAKNDVVFEMQGPYRIPTLRQVNAPPFAVVHTPVNPQKKVIAAPNGGHNVAIFKTTPERQFAGAQVARWLNAPHAQAQMCIRATSLPVSKAGFSSKELQDYLKTDAEMKGFIDLASYGWRWPALPSYEKINKALQDNVNAILKQEVGVKDGLGRAQRDAQAFLDEDVMLMK
ncbi:MAG TPA: extracellular solute-binding protein [Chloroflexota bacterium]|nr:extracellular solute-binding protein [Chloroflexota bacterium]